MVNGRGDFFYGVTIADGKYENYGLKTVAYDRIYHLGKDTYSFSFNEMPVRLDLEKFWLCSLSSKRRFSNRLIGSEKAITQNAKCFLESLSEREDNIFALFKKHFSAYLVDSVKVNQQANAKHFYLDQKYIDQESSLPM